jgi:hypothetical protein
MTFDGMSLNDFFCDLKEGLDNFKYFFAALTRVIVNSRVLD